MDRLISNSYKTNMATFVILALLLLSPIIYFSLPGLFNTQVHLRENTPVFSEPHMDAPLQGNSGKDADFPISGMKNFYFEKNPFGIEWHPIMEYTTFYKIKFNGKDAWASPDLFFLSENNIKNDHVSRNNYIWGVMFSFCGFIFLLLHGMKSFLKDMINGKNNAMVTFGVILFLLYLRSFLLFLYLYLSDNMVVTPTDEISYFTIGKDILNCNWNSKWSYTIGFPLLLIPFIAAFNPSSYFDIYDILRFWNAILIAPLSLMLVYLIIKKLSNSAINAFITILVLIIVPFFYYPSEAWNSFRALFMEPGLDICGLRPYYIFFWTGLNALSDIYSSLIVFLCIYLGLIMPRKMYSIILISFIFGFACLVRLNNIFIALLIAYLFYLKFKEELLSPVYMLKALLTAIIFFMAAFAWQFLINFLQFGSILIWPYSLHLTADRGFEISSLLNGGIDFLLQTNWIYMSAGVIGMFYIRDTVKRNIFVLWALPLITFFCGYICVFASPVRFILPAYGALVAAFICIDFMKKHNWKLIAFIITVIILNFVLVTPPFKYLDLQISATRFYIMSVLNITIPLLSVIASTIVLWKEKKLLVFMTAFFLIYYSGSGLVIFILMLILLLITMISVVREIYNSFILCIKKKYLEKP